MPNEAVEQTTSGSVWQAKQVYAMAAVCLLLGLAIGYLFRDSQSPAPPVPLAGGNQPAATAGPMGGQIPTLEDMKQMADKKAAPLLEKLKSDPNNSDLLIQIGNIYKATHQFKDAAGYYDKVVHLDPKNVAIRTELASCLYYGGDVDGAISQLQQSLRYDPVDANSLFQPRRDQVAGKTGRLGSSGSLAGVAEVESAIERGPQSRGAETDGRRCEGRSEEGQELAANERRDLKEH
jgi:cytochrome c-type biogenesis protein CcmH/NrfG